MLELGVISMFCVFCFEVIEYIRNVFQEVDVVGLGCCEIARQFEGVFVCVLQVSEKVFIVHAPSIF